jgi:two-component system NtrC family response regulator
MRTLSINLPALRERMEDLEPITMFHVKRCAEKYAKQIKNVSDDFFHVLSCYDWPGNVKELVGAIDVAVAMAGKEGTLFSKHLSGQNRLLAPPALSMPSGIYSFQ